MAVQSCAFKQATSFNGGALLQRDSLERVYPYKGQNHGSVGVPLLGDTGWLKETDKEHKQSCGHNLFTVSVRMTDCNPLQYIKNTMQ